MPSATEAATPAASPTVAGVDSSTGSSTVVVRDAVSGTILQSASAPHPPTFPPISEQDPAAWWSALKEAFGQVRPELREALGAISVDGQAHGLVPLDRHGQVIRPAKLWNDTTSAPHAERLVAELGAAEWVRRTGSVPPPAFTITKLAWLAEHEPGTLDRLATVLLPHDWVTYRLTGRFVTDRSEASGTGYFSPGTNRWRTDLLDLIRPGDWAARLPRVLGPEESAGTVTAEAAAHLGIPAGIPVGPGAADNQAASLGLGMGPGDVQVSLGTSGTVSAYSPTEITDLTGTLDGVADATGGFQPLACTLNATKVTAAIARLLDVDFSELERLALAATGPRRLTLLPFFDGERTPHRPGASGAIVGLRSDVSREELARAAFEGVLCGPIEGIDRLTEVGVDISGRLVITGGGARSGAYRQLLADLSGRDVHLVEAEDSAAAGAAVQAAAILAGESVAETARRWAPASRVVARPREDPWVAQAREAHRALVAVRTLDDIGG